MPTISCKATAGYATDKIYTETNRVAKVGCGQILRQISLKIKSRIDQLIPGKTEHPPLFGVPKNVKKQQQHAA